MSQEKLLESLKNLPCVRINAHNFNFYELAWVTYKTRLGSPDKIDELLFVEGVFEGIEKLTGECSGNNPNAH